jgi:DNA-binding PadR family transcriptional regulator
MCDVADTVGVKLSAGTLYAVITRLQERGYILALPAEDRRRPYRLTAAGASELTRQTRRMRQLADLAAERSRLVARPAGA